MRLLLLFFVVYYPIWGPAFYAVALALVVYWIVRRQLVATSFDVLVLLALAASFAPVLLALLVGHLDYPMFALRDLAWLLFSVALTYRLYAALKRDECTPGQVIDDLVIVTTVVVIEGLLRFVLHALGYGWAWLTPPVHGWRLITSAGDWMTTGSLVLVVLPFVVARAFRSAWWWPLVVLLFAFLMVGGSRAALLAATLSVVLLLLYMSCRRLLVAGTVLLFLAGQVLALVVYWPLVAASRSSILTDTGRFVWWSDALQCLADNPFGVGFGQYVYCAGGYCALHPHNALLHYAVQLGLFGLLLVLLVVQIGLYLWRRRRGLLALPHGRVALVALASLALYYQFGSPLWSQQAVLVCLVAVVGYMAQYHMEVSIMESQVQVHPADEQVVRFPRWLIVGLFVSLAVVLAVAVNPDAAYATAVTFLGTGGAYDAGAPPVSSADVIGTGFNWFVPFGMLVLVTIGWRFAPKIARAIKSMAR